ncbi:MAG: zinc ABC transporter substrate-binding protein [Calditrichia bacterium]|nr:zinc ABC transporter substrate-binding protein [Calditrichia bacterium]
MQIKRIKILLCFLMVFFGWHTIEAQELNIVTTLPSLASITKSIGGEHVEVYSITRGVQDAHYIEAKPSYMVKLNRADLLIYSGLELEIGWLPLLIQGARNHDVTPGASGHLNASLAISTSNILEKPRGEVDRSMGDVHPAGNPHYLLNPYYGIKVAEQITDKLIELDPSHMDVYDSNFEQFRTELQKKITEFETEAAILKGIELVCYHVHWSYLLNWLDIKAAGYVELRPGIPPTPRHKKEITALMKRKNLKIVIISSWKDPTKAEEVADVAEAKLLILPGEVNAMPGADSYIEWLDYMVRNLVDVAIEVEPETTQRQRDRQREQKRGTK